MNVVRYTDFKSSRPSTASLLPTTLSDIEAVTARTGFLQQQLKLADLSPLRRWYLELKLMVAHSKRNLQTEADNVDAALLACDLVLNQDQRVFDVVYRHGMQVGDARDILLDEKAPLAVDEVLSFSTCSKCLIVRITCVRNGMQVHFNSSLYVDNLQAELQRLMDEKSSIETVINFVSKAANRY
ncbi:hypothetical protein DVH05_024382 [Phytophthora capsici]|nr:hypothetical protein DVH05_024382 [Phytophthora capsici]